MYPHQVLMEENNLTKDTLSKEAQGFLKDFNHYLNTINMKLKRLEKQNKEAIVTESEMSKLNRLSKSVVFQIYTEMREDIDLKKKEKEEEERIKKEAEELKKQQEQEEIEQKAQLEEMKRQEEQQARITAEKQAEEIEQRELAQAEAKRKKQEAEKSNDLMDFFF